MISGSYKVSSTGTVAYAGLADGLPGVECSSADGADPNAVGESFDVAAQPPMNSKNAAITPLREWSMPTVVVGDL
jgi:hypothetical protein